MSVRALSLVFTVAACGRAQAPTLDSSVAADAPGDGHADGPNDAAIDAAVTPYRHTIVVDGVDDFATADQFPTTSAAYTARISWDAQNIYVGYRGPDLDPSALDANTKWLFAYVDVDPGGSTGATTSQMYNTQRATFPTGFGAEYYARWKCDTTVRSIEQHAGGVWSTIGTSPPAAQAGTFVELAIPRSVLGGSTSIGLVTWMINEKNMFEGSFAGLYATSFTDGYATQLPITKYLNIDFTSPRGPNDVLNQRP